MDKTSHGDLEVKDAQIIFNSVWKKLEKNHSKKNLSFPKEIIWLGGAPGAGKGTNTEFILKKRGINAPAIVTSSLLDSPEATIIKNKGGFVGDKEVITILLNELLKDIYKKGVVVDGFPRTKVQVECLKLLYQKMIHLQKNYKSTKYKDYFPYPIFHIVLLFVDEKESIKRQLKRGREASLANKDVRVTDLNPDAVKDRYRLFKETTFKTLSSLKEIFHFHFIDASGGFSTVQKEIEKELQYQSSLELEEDSYNLIRSVPIANDLIGYARQDLVNRINHYKDNHYDLFKKIINIITSKYIPIIKRYTLTGRVIINSEDTVFDDPLAVSILIDVFCERGYQAMVDVNKVDVPDHIDMNTGKIFNISKLIYRIYINFTPSTIRQNL